MNVENVSRKLSLITHKNTIDICHNIFTFLSQDRKCYGDLKAKLDHPLINESQNKQ